VNIRDIVVLWGESSKVNAWRGGEDRITTIFKSSQDHVFLPETISALVATSKGIYHGTEGGDIINTLDGGVVMHQSYRIAGLDEHTGKLVGATQIENRAFGIFEVADLMHFQYCSMPKAFPMRQITGISVRDSMSLYAAADRVVRLNPQQRGSETVVSPIMADSVYVASNNRGVFMMYNGREPAISPKIEVVDVERGTRLTLGVADSLGYITGAAFFDDNVLVTRHFKVLRGKGSVEIRFIAAEIPKEPKKFEVPARTELFYYSVPVSQVPVCPSNDLAVMHRETFDGLINESSYRNQVLFGSAMHILE
jgi:hypothetical protein